MTDFVVDASVAIKWVLEEDYSLEARRLLQEDYSLLVPDFFFAEIGNVLWKRVQRTEMSLTDARADYIALSAYPWLVFPSKGLVTEAIKLATEIKQAVYDAIYLRLAIENGCQMVTADSKLMRATTSLEAVQPHLLWVEDIPEVD